MGGAPLRSRSALLFVAPLLASSGAAVFASTFEGCSTQGTAVTTDGGGSLDAAPPTPEDAAGGDADAGALPDAAPPPIDGAATPDSAPGDGGGDADAVAPSVTGLAIVSAYGTPLQGAPGDAIPLQVVLTLSDGSTRRALPGELTWIAPHTLVAEDPADAGGDIVPEAGTEPTAFYVRNDYRQEAPGTLFILDRGTVSNPQVTVTVAVADAGETSATVAILPAPVGDAAAGGNLFQHVLLCNGCHGETAGGTPPYVFPDGGAALLDGGPAYLIQGSLWPYPAPGLNAAPGSGHVAADPAWTEAMFAIAAQSDMDNAGVGLRQPMPMWAGGNNGTGNPLNAQNFADIYAWLKTQTQ